MYFRHKFHDSSSYYYYYLLVVYLDVSQRFSFTWRQLKLSFERGYFFSNFKFIILIISYYPILLLNYNYYSTNSSGWLPSHTLTHARIFSIFDSLKTIQSGCLFDFSSVVVLILPFRSSVCPIEKESWFIQYNLQETATTPSILFTFDFFLSIRCLVDYFSQPSSPRPSVSSV